MTADSEIRLCYWLGCFIDSDSAIDTRVTNIDVVIGRGQAAASTNAHCILLPVLLKSALSPLAVLLLPPVVLFKSALDNRWACCGSLELVF